jgi:hypothetical protein
MELDRRQAILSVAMALVARPARAKPERIESELPECHQLTRSLIERARRASDATNPVDTDAIERLVRRTVGASGSQPVIKWMPSPEDAFDRLRKLGSLLRDRLAGNVLAGCRDGVDLRDRSFAGIRRTARVGRGPRSGEGLRSLRTRPVGHVGDACRAGLRASDRRRVVA